jgi:hypothetical protein
MTKKSKVTPRVAPEREPTTVTIQVPSDFYVKAQGWELNAERLQNIMPAGIAYLLKVGLRGTLRSVGYIGDKEKARLIKQGKDPDRVAAERIQKRLADITAGTLGEGHRFQKRDPVETMVRQIVNERIASTCRRMAYKPDKARIAKMVERLMKLQADDIRAEAQQRLAAEQRFASSPIIDQLTANHDDNEDDSKDSSSVVMMEAAE